MVMVTLFHLQTLKKDFLQDDKDNWLRDFLTHIMGEIDLGEVYFIFLYNFILFYFCRMLQRGIRSLKFATTDYLSK